MRILDSHFHWWPRRIFEQLCARKEYPRAGRIAGNGYDYWRKPGAKGLENLGSDWFDLDEQLAHMDKLGHHVDVISSIGPLSLHFSDVPLAEGRDTAIAWNEETAAIQRKNPGRFWGTAAVPLTDTQTAIDVLDHAVTRLGLVGVNVPGSIGNDPRIDADRLAPFYARIEELDIPLFLHPTDAIFYDMLAGYDGALHLSLGRVIEVSVAASRIMFSGLMARHPKLKVIMSHTGGALPYQSGRMDKNGKKARLPEPPSTYIKRMYTDTVSPHSLGMKFAIEYYGIDHVMYGTDYPCWDPATCLSLLGELDLSATDKQKLFYDNARNLFGLDRKTQQAARTAA